MEKECPQEGQEDIRFKDQISDAGRQPILQRALSSLVTLRQGSSDVSIHSSRSLIARTWAWVAAPSSRWGSTFTRLALAAGCMIQVALLFVLVVKYGGRAFSSRQSPPGEDDDDSDGSVLALGHGLDDYVWWDISKSSSIITSTSQTPGINLIAPPWSAASLDDVFNECGLAESWKDAKTDDLAEELTGELAQGKSSFFSKSVYASEQTQPTCIIYVMQVALHYVPANLVLQEFTRAGYKNHFLSDELRLPKTKFRNFEPVEDCFKRCITLKLGLSHNIAERFASSAVLLRADEEATTGSAAAGISNMSTIVRKLTVLVQLTIVEDKLRKHLGIEDGNLYVDSRGMEFQWEKVGEDHGLRKLLKKAPDARKVKPYWKPTGNAVLPWSPSDVSKELTSRGIEPVSFGKDFSELVKKLRTGQVQLGIEEASGNLVCVEHRVYLKLSKKNGDFLVHEGDGSMEASLPHVVLLANETPWIAALRTARSQLGSVFMRVELQLRSQNVKTSLTIEPPKMFSNGKPIAYVVREIVVEALAC